MLPRNKDHGWDYANKVEMIGRQIKSTNNKVQQAELSVDSIHVEELNLPFSSSVRGLGMLVDTSSPEYKKKSETEFTASVLKKRSKTHKRLKERFLIGRNRTKCANFRGSPLFQATYNIKTEKQTTYSAYLGKPSACLRTSK